MLDTDTTLIISIYRAVVDPDSAQTDPKLYLQEHEFYLKAIGRVFEYLGLATYESKRVLGWRPSVQFLESIGLSLLRAPKASTRAASIEDQHILALIKDAVYCDLDDVQRQYASLMSFEILRAIGLLRGDIHGGWIPTVRLRRRFAEGYFRRQPFGSR